MKKLSALEEMMALHIRGAKIAAPVREFCFHPTRKWRFDFAWPDKKLAVECEGGTFSGGRHTTGSGFEKDSEKYNAAVLQGWRVLRFTSTAIRSGVALQTVLVAMDMTGGFEVIA